ncbi:MAG TPA: hypothetical protein VEC37_10160 [Bacillota bacterium]|nr:hypothetical protein [Bacillota bacterium]
MNPYMAANSGFYNGCYGLNHCRSLGFGQGRNVGQRSTILCHTEVEGTLEVGQRIVGIWKEKLTA